MVHSLYRITCNVLVYMSLEHIIHGTLSVSNYMQCSSLHVFGTYKHGKLAVSVYIVTYNTVDMQCSSKHVFGTYNTW